MATQKYTTLGQGALQSAYTAGNTSITLQSGQGATFPSSGDFAIAIDSPPAFFLKCTARSGDVLTVTATGIDGSTPVNKLSGIVVVEVITASVLDAIRADMVQTGTDASKASDRQGNIYLPTDGYSLLRDTGSVFARWGPVFAFNDPVTPISGFSWVNQGGASLDTTGGGCTITAPANAGDQVRMLVMSTPSTPYTLTMGFFPHIYPENFHSCGFVWRDSASGKLATFAMNQSGAVQIGKWNSPTSYNADYLAVSSIGPQIAGGPLLVYQISDDGTNRICRVGKDFKHFLQLHTVGRTDFITPNQVGIFADSNNANHPAYITVVSWLQS